MSKFKCQMNAKIPAYRQALNLAWYRAGRQMPKVAKIHHMMNS
jgi:hypothetical protein